MFAGLMEYASKESGGGLVIEAKSRTVQYLGRMQISAENHCRCSPVLKGDLTGC